MMSLVCSALLHNEHREAQRDAVSHDRALSHGGTQWLTRWLKQETVSDVTVDPLREERLIHSQSDEMDH